MKTIALERFLWRLGRGLLLSPIVWVLLPLGVVLAPIVSESDAVSLHGRLLHWQVMVYVRPAAARHRVPEGTMMSLLYEESGWRPNPPISKVHGAVGMPQIKATTWATQHCEGQFGDLGDMIMCAGKILSAMHSQCEQNDPNRKYWAKAVAAYNVGTSGCPSIKRGHVQRVLDGAYRWQVNATERG